MRGCALVGVAAWVIAVVVLGLSPAAAGAYVHDSQEHVAVAADGSLTADAEAWIRTETAAAEAKWRAQPTPADEDIKAYHKMLVNRFLPPAGRVLPLAMGQATEAQVCGWPMGSNCWLYERDDTDVTQGSQNLYYAQSWSGTEYCDSPTLCTFADGPREDLFKTNLDWPQVAGPPGVTCNVHQQPGGTIH
jgi:hypothetical protein